MTSQAFPLSFARPRLKFAKNPADINMQIDKYHSNEVIDKLTHSQTY